MKALDAGDSKGTKPTVSFPSEPNLPFRPILAPGDYRLCGEFEKRHLNADLLEYDVASGLPTRAIYNNPVYQVCVADVRAFFGAVDALMEAQVEENG